MSQQINLLNPALIRPRDWLSLRNLVLIYMGALVVMVILHQYTQAEADALQHQRNQAVATFESTQKQLKQMTAAMHGPADNAAQERELDSLRKKYESQQRILSAFRQIQSDDGHHVLDVMRGFAEIRQPDVWLTGFKLDAFDHSVALNGRAMQAEQVPAYIEKLGRIAVFKGQLFSGLILKTSQPPASAAIPDAVPAATIGSTAPAASAVAPAKPLVWIDFEIKGYAQATLPAPEVSAPEPAMPQSQVTGQPATQSATSLGTVTATRSLPAPTKEVRHD